VGIDAHEKTLQDCVFDGSRVVSEWEIAHELKGVQRLARKLVRLAAGGELRCCYEAGPLRLRAPTAARGGSARAHLCAIHRQFLRRLALGVPGLGRELA
jgi:hypothetical protein